ncbi:hypothetical protein [Atopomonas hussainii]|uniref:hypothetical protein n=1 Tax=Atopomonas hussainii TaxID=1429083 RepID=UPI0009003A25|nr:hypothetical protein [Atopomonas hussainii]
MPSLTLKTHLGLLLMSFVTWGLFVLIGWPDYYQSWPFFMKLAAVVAVTLLYIPLTPFILRLFCRERFVAHSLWLALYLTVPLFIYDYLYIVLIGGDDMGFVFSYWYLSFFYFSFWLQMPLVAHLLMREPSENNA